MDAFEMPTIHSFHLNAQVFAKDELSGDKVFVADARTTLAILAANCSPTTAHHKKPNNL